MGGKTYGVVHTKPLRSTEKELSLNMNWKGLWIEAYWKFKERIYYETGKVPGEIRSAPDESKKVANETKKVSDNFTTHLTLK